MNCQRCQSNRVASLTAKCSDCCGVTLCNSEIEGYVPKDLGIGGGDYVELDFCLECGQIQGMFPRPPSALEKDVSDEELIDFYHGCFYEGQVVGSLNNSLIPQIKRAATKLSNKFGKFIDNVIEYGCEDHAYGNKFPSAQEFVTYYRYNDYGLIDDG